MIEEKYLSFLSFLDLDNEDSLFAQREENFERIPFEMERTLYRFVYLGKPDEMIAFYKNMITSNFSLKLPLGRTSAVKLRQLKYSAVAAIALACRAAILGGALEAKAYALSDDSILAIDTMTSPLAIIRKEAATVLDFARMVKEMRQSGSLSPEVKRCMEYISTHTHGPISLEDIAAGSQHSKEYLAKLFRKEVGLPIRDYMMRERMEEAKALLRETDNCGQIAYTLGFSSQSHFIRQFKKYTGVTPGQWRSLNQALDGEEDLFFRTEE